MINNLTVKNFSLFDNIAFSFGDKLNVLIWTQKQAGGMSDAESARQENCTQ